MNNLDMRSLIVVAFTANVVNYCPVQWNSGIP